MKLLLAEMSLTVASDLYRLAQQSGDRERVHEAALELRRAAIAYTAALHALVYGALPVSALGRDHIRALRPEDGADAAAQHSRTLEAVFEVRNIPVRVRVGEYAGHTGAIVRPETLAEINGIRDGLPSAGTRCAVVQLDENLARVLIRLNDLDATAV